MNLRFLLYFVFLLILLTPAGKTVAQKTSGTAKSPVAPKLRTLLGNLPGGKINLEEALTLLDRPIIVKDEKGNDFSIISFRLSWRTTDVFEDEGTGEKRSHRNDISKTLTGNILTETLRESIKEELKKGDELLYEKVIVQGKDGNKYLAPSLQFTVQ